MSNVNETTLRTAYQLVSEFLDAINRSDTELLRSKFDIDDKVYREIQESLEMYFYEEELKNLNLSPPPLDNILKDREIFEFYKNNDGFWWALDCQLFNNSAISDPTIKFELHKDGDNFSLVYCCIDS
jgi:hypothetical protein